MKKIKILQVIGGLNRGGAETMLINLYRKLDKSKYDFVFLTYTKGQPEQDYEKEINATNGTIVKLEAKNLKNPILHYKDLYDVMTDDNYDCVHCHTLLNSGIVMKAAKKAGIPIRITHSHSCGNMKKETFVYKVYSSISHHFINKYSTNKIACGQDAGEYLFGNNFDGIIINNGIDLERFQPCASPHYEIDYTLKNKDTLKIAAVGSFYKVKNHTFMISLAKYLKDHNIDFHMYFAGRGPLEEKIREQIHNNALDNYISLLGILENVNELLSSVDVVIMPSLYEGVPVSLIEAQACGVPAVISKNISKEVDLNLGLIHFLDINENYKEWTDQLLYYKNLPNINKEDIIKRFNEKHYSISENLETLTSIYNG